MPDLCYHTRVGKRVGVIVGHRRRQGASLLEALIALALLTSVLAVFILLFHQSFRMGSRAQRASIATRLAENALEDIRDWASRPADWDAGFGAFTASPLIDPEFPDYPILVEVTPLTIYSPCRSFEEALAWAPGGARSLVDSVVTVEVQVAWGSGPHETVRLVSQLAEPARPLAGMAVALTRTAGPADPVPANQEVTYQAQLQDGSDPIPDIMFQWYLKPLASPGTPPGNGTLRTTRRDGVEAIVENRYLFNPNLPESDPGRWRRVAGLVGVVARARYHGRLIPPEGAPPSEVVEMAP